MTLCARAIVDKDIQSAIARNAINRPSIGTLIFLKQSASKKSVIDNLNQIPGITIQDLGFMPAIAILVPQTLTAINQIADMPEVAQISSYKPSAVELDVSSQILKLKPSQTYPDVNNWWAHGYTGKNKIIGLIDTGLDTYHPALSQKNLILRKEEGSKYSEFTNGVKEPHGTGVACIYTSTDEQYKGIAFGASTIISGLSGEETADTSSLMLTMGTLDWMLNRASLKPNIINYSMGNGKLADTDAPQWSGLAKVIDYVVNTQKILWVKSAGNMGYIAPTNTLPYASTLTVPGDNYNALTIANMDANVTEFGKTARTADRNKHIIRNTSSRGPTPFGRRKPDLTAPGHDTRTCAPDPTIYQFNYTPAMDYKNGYRLMGGTSSAAPHVGASVLLLQDAGITDPMAIKALLINSADTWTDSGTPSTGHAQIEGSAWNRTYGWGYLNMEKAFNQRNNIIRGELTIAKPTWEIKTTIRKGEKVTLVHERRVGYTKEGKAWQLSPLSLEILNKKTGEIISFDDSKIDSVHQVSYCKRLKGEKTCQGDEKPMEVIIQVSLKSTIIDGSLSEPFALVTEAPPLFSKGHSFSTRVGST